MVLSIEMNPRPPIPPVVIALYYFHSHECCVVANTLPSTISIDDVTNHQSLLAHIPSAGASLASVRPYYFPYHYQQIVQLLIELLVPFLDATLPVDMCSFYCIIPITLHCVCLCLSSVACPSLPFDTLIIVIFNFD